MKTASPAVSALLASNMYLYADLFTITLSSGTVLYYTNADGNLVFGGNTFYGTSPKIQHDGYKSSVNVTVDTTHVTIYAGAADLLSGITFPQFAANGGFDGATIQIDRCFMGSFGDTSAGVVNVFLGLVTGVTPSRTAVTLEVSSMLVLLNINMPRNVYKPGCSHTLFDAGCSLAKSAFGSASTALSGSTTSVLNCGLAQAAGYFNLGTLSFTGGANAGVSRTIKSYTAGVLTLAQPLPYTPASGDAFTAYAGCDKQMSTCGGAPNIYTVASSIFTFVKAHGYVNGQKVKVATSSAAPAPLVVGTAYYVSNASATTLQLSATSGGGALTITTAGTGTQTMRAPGTFDNLANFRGFPFIPVPTVSM